jgi:hypothetical protein
MKSFRLVSLLPLVALQLSCGDDANVSDAGIDAEPPTGTFSLSWSLTDGTNALECSDVGAVTVSVALVPQGGLNGDVYPFTCEAASGTSAPVPPGVYNATLDVRGGTPSRSLLANPQFIDGVTITANSDTPLGAKSFTIDPTGNFTFYVDAGASAGNCSDDPVDGGQIVGFEFELRDSNGACVDGVDFVIPDADPLVGGTYTTNCTTPPAPFGCIGKAQEIAVSGIRSGSYSLSINGQKAGPIDCYSRQSNFVVAGNDLVTSVGTLALDLEYSAECDPNFMPPDAGLIDAGIDAAP